ncbi:MAG: fibronectin type domain protein [Pedosphaera sp.]|nr:fibronectin type domain protein [Pedosphaera sp.]
MTYKQWKRNSGKTSPNKQSRFMVVIALCMLSCAAARGSQSVPLAWDPNQDASVAGYVVYYGNTSGNYSSSLDVGTNTTATISGLTEGQTNYFAVSAYNSARVEGARSSQIVYLVPGALIMAPRAKPTDPLTLNFPVAPGHWYEVQATTNLTSWTTIWQTTAATSNAWVQFQDPKAGLFPKRFYRTVLH